MGSVFMTPQYSYIYTASVSSHILTPQPMPLAVLPNYLPTTGPLPAPAWNGKLSPISTTTPSAAYSTSTTLDLRPSSPPPTREHLSPAPATNPEHLPPLNHIFPLHVCRASQASLRIATGSAPPSAGTQVYTPRTLQARCEELLTTPRQALPFTDVLAAERTMMGGGACNAREGTEDESDDRSSTEYASSSPSEDDSDSDVDSNATTGSAGTGQVESIQQGPCSGMVRWESVQLSGLFSHGQVGEHPRRAFFRHGQVCEHLRMVLFRHGQVGEHPRRDLLSNEQVGERSSRSPSRHEQAVRSSKDIHEGTRRSAVGCPSPKKGNQTQNQMQKQTPRRTVPGNGAGTCREQLKRYMAMGHHLIPPPYPSLPPTTYPQISEPLG